MMRLHIVAIGRMRRGIELDLFNYYKSRIKWPLELHEIDKRKHGIKIFPEHLIIAAIPDKAVVAVLDEKGSDLCSQNFAGIIKKWRDSGIGDIVFLIGGPDGLPEKVKQTADLSIAFGRFTWPHLLIRGMLTEQIYRAQQILSKHPYHRA